MSEAHIDSATQKTLDALIKQEEGEANNYRGWLAVLLTLVAVGMSLFHLYAAYSIVPTQYLRTIHVSLVLFLVYLSFPVADRYKNRLMWWDVIFAVASIAVVVYMLYWGDAFGDRAITPTQMDQVFGVARNAPPCSPRSTW